MDAKPFARELACLREPAQREAKLLERLRELPPDAAVEVLHELMLLAVDADEDARIALGTCVGLARFESALGYERVSALYLAADERGYDEVKRMLRSSEVKRKPPRDGVENEFLEKPLGERTELARTTRDRNLLDRLLRDRNPRVIANLLRNARLVETDVVLIAASRPSSPALLNEVMRSHKWFARIAVKRALALNPYLPVGEVMAILPSLPAPDLEEVVASLEVAAAVRETAREIVARRQGSGSKDEAN